MSDSIIVFDLGGVMVKVAYTWEAAVAKSGESVRNPERLVDRLSACPGFDPFQAGAVSQTEYLDQLKDYLGLADASAALRVHNAILLHPFEGTLENIDELHRRGIETSCLSNTNGPHWELMSNPDLFPAIAALRQPVLSHELKAEKPFPEIYHKFEAKTGYPAEKIIFFDDLEANVKGALDCGWDAVQIDPDRDPAAQVRKALEARKIL